jgi:hypothetical protein
MPEGAEACWLDGRFPDTLPMSETPAARALRTTRDPGGRNHTHGDEMHSRRGRRTVTGSRAQPTRHDRERLILTLIALLLAAAALPARAQDELAGDRPRASESSRVVTLHRAQFEGGLRVGVDGDTIAVRAPEFLLRLAVLSRLEFRLGLPDYRRTRKPGGGTRGLGESYIGLKAQLFPSDGRFGLAVIPGLTKPADKNDHGDVAPELVLAWSDALSPSWSLGGDLGRSWREGAHRGADVSRSALAVTRTLGVRGATFVEWVAGIPDRGGAAHILQHGYTLAVFPDGQLDLRVGAGLTRAAPDFFIGAGFVVRH